MAITVAGVLATLSTGMGAAYSAVGLRLFGKLMELPEAWADSKIQPLRDMTAARSAIAKAATEQAIKQGIENPQLWGGAAEALIGDFERKVTNKMAVFNASLRHEVENKEKLIGFTPSAPDEDWLNVFGRYAEDASSDKLRDLFGRILAGEVRKSGSFSISTLRVMSELSKNTADAFSKIHEDSIDGMLPDYKKYQSGKNLVEVGSLIDAGFLASSQWSISGEKDQSNDEFDYTKVNFGSDPTLQIDYKHGKKGKFSLDMEYGLTIRYYTEMGRQISFLLPKPDYAKNLRAIADEVPFADKVSRLELHFSDGAIETLPIPASES